MTTRSKLFFSLVSLAVAPVLALAATGCAGASDGAEEDEDTSAEEALRARVTPGTFKMYTDVGHTPARGCDIFTKLDLVAYGSGSSARLENRAEGICAVMLNPDLRTFRLKEAPASCGVRIFTGAKGTGSKRRAVKITDYRSATCALGAAPIVLEETFAGGDVETRYSSSQAAPGPGTPSAWLTYAPRQCQSNPWNGSMPMHAPASSLGGEAGLVDTYFKAQNVDLLSVGFLAEATPMAHCAACQCGRGDLLLVEAKDADAAKRLVDDFGFELATDKVLSSSVRSCNTSAWGANTNLATWAKAQGQVAFAGVVQPTTPVITCMACGCPTGDDAVVVATNDATRTALLSKGFGPLD